MKTFSSILFIILCTIGYSQNRDTRTLSEINDSILLEAQLIYRFDKAFNTAMVSVDADKKIRTKAGEILIMPSGKDLRALVFSKETTTQIVGEMVFDEYIDSTTIVTVQRPASSEEMDLLSIKHKVMSGVQSEYEIEYGNDETYLNPIFIPYKEKIGNKSIQLYKLYLMTETNASNTIPFGRDYLFIAKANGSIFYNLQFNKYIPVSISEEVVENQSVTIEYPEREPYITPTDIYLFSKYGAPKDLLDLRVKSNYLGVIFDYNWDRETLDVVME